MLSVIPPDLVLSHWEGNSVQLGTCGRCPRARPSPGSDRIPAGLCCWTGRRARGGWAVLAWGCVPLEGSPCRISHRKAQDGALIGW